MNHENNEITPEQCEALAAKERQNAEEAFQSSEYPRLGKAAHNELAEAYENLAQESQREGYTPKNDSAFELKKAARVRRLIRRAAWLKVEAARKAVHSHGIGRGIPFGQPILVGHHSERRHRNAIEKMHNATRKSIELSNAAADAERAARAAIKSHAISSDDPTACEQLREKIEKMEAQRDNMKAINKLCQANDIEGLKSRGLSEQQIHTLMSPKYSFEKKGFQGWQLTNLGANIRRCKERLKELEEKTQGGLLAGFSHESEAFTVFEDAEENRICFKFPGKPAEQVRSALKSRGFKWSPTRGLWVRMLNDSARHSARYAIQDIEKLNGEG